MKKRLRKKLHLGEFTQYGILISKHDGDEDLDFELHNKILDELIDFLEENNLYIGGSLNGALITRYKKTSSIEDLNLIKNFLDKYNLSYLVADELVDIHHG